VAVVEGAEEAGDGYPVPLIRGCWLSRLERCVHIAEVAGSNPAQPTGFRLVVTMSSMRAVDSAVSWLFQFITFLFVDVRVGTGSRHIRSVHRGREPSTPPWYVFRPRSSTVGTALSIAAPLVAGIGLLLAQSWWPLAVSLGLLLAIAAWFKGTKLGLWSILIGGFVLQWAVAIAAMLKYG
jgi:hypothetical protein